MKLYYALYDQSAPVDGDYWNWWAVPEIRHLLNRIYGDVAVKHLPPKPNDLHDDDLWGGAVCLADWTVVYRYFNGGWDNIGRPGRAVLMTAWIPAGDAKGFDLTPILTSKAFRHVAEHAKSIPVPPPPSLQEEWTTAKRVFATTSAREGETPFTGLEQAMCAFSGVSAQRKAKFVIADVKIIQTAREQRFVLNVAPELVTAMPEQRVSSQPEPPRHTPSPQKKERIPESHHPRLGDSLSPKLAIGLGIACVALLMMGLYANGQRKKVSDMKGERSNLNQTIAGLELTNARLKAENTGLRTENDGLKHENARLIEELKKPRQEKEQINPAPAPEKKPSLLEKMLPSKDHKNPKQEDENQTKPGVGPPPDPKPTPQEPEPAAMKKAGPAQPNMWQRFINWIRNLRF